MSVPIAPAWRRESADQLTNPAFFLRLAFNFGRGRNNFAEFLKEIASKLFARRINQATTQLGQFTANLRLDGIMQYRRIAIRLKGNLSTPFGKARSAARTFAGDCIAIRGIEIG